MRCIRPEGEQDVTFTNPDRSLSSYGYDKVYGGSCAAGPQQQQQYNVAMFVQLHVASAAVAADQGCGPLTAFLQAHGCLIG